MNDLQYTAARYGGSVRVSLEAMEAEAMAAAMRRKPSRRQRFVAWASHRPVLLVAVLGFVCGAVIVAIFELV